MPALGSIGARYDLSARLGEGSFGEVYAARDRLRGEDVALKLLKRASPAAIVRFKREFRALRDLAHPNLIALRELLADDPTWFFTMELIDGVDLATWLGRGDRVRLTVATGDDFDDELTPTSAPPAPLDLARIASALDQIADGLDAVHGAGQLHCDLKPGNVLVDRGGRLRLLDFGMVASIGDRAGRGGTPWFTAPEQVVGDPLAPASDWYGVGVMLYDAAAGRFPFTGDGDDVRLAKLAQVPPSLAVVAPGAPPALVALVDGLLARSPAARPRSADVRAIARSLRGQAAAPPAAPVAGGDAIALVGRDRELAALRTAWADARAGAPVVARVLGSSGIGKTALARHFVAGLGDDAWVLAGRSYEREQLPFRALDPVIDELAARLTRLPADARAALLPADAAYLGRLFPALRPVTGAADEGAPGEVRRRAFAAARALLTRLAAAVPVVLWLDDLQWSDADSGALLAAILHGPDAPALLCLASCRSEDAGASPVLAALAAGPGALRTVDVRVDGLAPDAARALARAVAGDRGDVDAIAAEAAGSPFLVRELALAGADGRGARLTVDDMVGARVARLPDAARELLAAVALAGRPIDERIAAAACASPVGAREIAALRAASLLRATAASTAGRDELDTYHDRIRDAVVGGHDPAARRAGHARLAAALAAAGGDPEAIAIHHAAAGDRPAALAAARLAADLAEAAGAHERAAAHLAFALAVADNAATRRGLARRRGDALAAAGQGPAAAALYAELAGELAGAEATELRRRAAELLLTCGYLDAGMAQLASVLDALELRVPPTPRRAVASLVIHRAQLAVRGTRHRERAAAAVAPDALIRVDACWSLAVGLSMADHIRGADFQARHLLAALATGEPTRIARGLALEAVYSSTPGTRGRARSRRLIARAQALADRTGDPLALAMVTIAEGIGAQQVGEWRRGAERCEAAIALLARCPAAFHELASAHFFWLKCMSHLGELAAVSAALPGLRDRAVHRGDVYTLRYLRAGPVLLWRLWHDPPDALIADARAIVAELPRDGFHVQHLGAMNTETAALLARGDGAAAGARLARDRAPLERSQLLRAQSVLIETLSLRGRCALATGRRGEAATAAHRIRGERVPWADALAALLEAGVAGTRAGWRAAARACAGADMPLHAGAALARAGEPAALAPALVAALAPVAG